MLRVIGSKSSFLKYKFCNHNIIQPFISSIPTVLIPHPSILVTSHKIRCFSISKNESEPDLVNDIVVNKVKTPSQRKAILSKNIIKHIWDNLDNTYVFKEVEKLANDFTQKDLEILFRKNFEDRAAIYKGLKNNEPYPNDAPERSSPENVNSVFFDDKVKLNKPTEEKPSPGPIDNSIQSTVSYLVNEHKLLRRWKGKNISPYHHHYARCIICAKNTPYLHYKTDYEFLNRFINEYGRIVPSFLTFLCNVHQRKVARAIKAARNIRAIPSFRKPNNDELPKVEPPQYPPEKDKMIAEIIDKYIS